MTDDGFIEYRNEIGQLHCIDGPSVIHPDGTKEWHINGKRHRIDGPALIWANGGYLWFVDDHHQPNKRRFQSKSGLSDEEMTILILKYGEIL